MKPPFFWDKYSDQPYPIKDKKYKKKMRQKEMFSLINTFITALFVLPLSILALPFTRKKTIVSSDFFSIVVDFEKEPTKSIELINELNLSTILIRFKLWEMDTLEALKEFILQNKEKKIILKIMQDRENIEDKTLLKNNLIQIFTTLGDMVDFYEIGTTINRAKWGFFSVREYNEFYKVAYDLKKKEFPNIKLMGSSVIDFEFYYTAHTLFNFSRIKFDAISSLLYVDRRGAPENIQLGFNLVDKIALLGSMVWLSPKTKYDIHITETNWPLSNTAPYAPTSEYECIDTQTYASYMVRYYLLSLATQQVTTLSWHQLIAPGYGLIDNRKKLKKYPAFFAYKTMVQLLKNAQFLRLDILRGYYIFQALVNDELIQVHWSLLIEKTLEMTKNAIAFDIFGNKISNKQIIINTAPIYVIYKKSDNE